MKSYTVEGANVNAKNRNYEGGNNPLLFSFKIFSLVLLISFIFQILIFFLSNPLTEYEIKISCYDEVNFNVKDIENFYFEKGVKRIKISKNNDMLIINYWDNFGKRYIIPNQEKIGCKIKTVYMLRNFFSSIFSNSNLFLLFFSFQLSLILFNLFYIIKKSKEFFIFSIISKKILTYSIICLTILIFFGFLWEEFITKTFSNFLFNYVKEMGLKNKFIFLIIGGFLAPLNEEIFFRGIILGKFLKSNLKILGILTSSFLFSLAHFDLFGLPIIFLFGIFLSYFYIESKSILTPIISHMLNNFIFFILAF